MRRRRGGRQQCSRSGRCRTARRMGKFDPKATIEIYPMNGRKARESGLSDMLHPCRVLLWPSGAVCGAGGVGRGPEARPQFLDRAQAPNPAVHGGFRAPAGRLAKSGRGGMMRQLAAMRARPRGKKPRTRRLRYAEQSPAFRSIGVVPRQSRARRRPPSA
jgi:hypothetical protein